MRPNGYNADPHSRRVVPDRGGIPGRFGNSIFLLRWGGNLMNENQIHRNPKAISRSLQSKLQRRKTKEQKKKSRDPRLDCDLVRMINVMDRRHLVIRPQINSADKRSEV